MIDFDYVSAVYDKITNNPSAEDFDFFLEARAVVGNYVATAESQWELAKANREYQEAAHVLAVKDQYPKYTAQQVEATVKVETRDFKTVENKKRSEYLKLKSVLESITEVINGIKFLGRYGGQ